MSDESTLSRAVMGEASNNVGIRETSKNYSPAISRFLAFVGISKPSPWCAAFACTMVNDACKKLGIKNKMPKSASVHALVIKAKKAGLWTPACTPGYLCAHDSGGGKGHMGIAASYKLSNDDVMSIEGNTNKAGSREGDSVEVKFRPMSYWNLGFIRTNFDEDKS